MALKCSLYVFRTSICPYPYINCLCNLLDDKSVQSVWPVVLIAMGFSLPSLFCVKKFLFLFI